LEILVTDDAPERVAIPEGLERRLSALRDGALQDGVLTQGEIRDLATELLSMLTREAPSKEQTDE
jgi:hypothetical protein